jgi:hypothetical protein
MQYKLELYTWVKQKGAKITLEEFSLKWEEIEMKRLSIFKTFLEGGDQ